MPKGAHRKLQKLDKPDTLCFRVRSALDMTQADFAAHIGTTENTIYRWEKGAPPLTIYQRALERLARGAKVLAP
jgi:DNA-binding XRE family transcriptional regulator